jgi:SAM-dependent methyltransferase
MRPSANDVTGRELAYHERLYSGFAQRHFARPAVRALREHMVTRILKVTGAWGRSRVLSLGCGIGDTELLLARQVNEIVGIDLSPAAVRQARADAERLGIANARFEEGETPPEGAGPLAPMAASGRRALFARPQPPPALRRRGPPLDAGFDEALPVAR